MDKNFLFFGWWKPPTTHTSTDIHPPNMHMKMSTHPHIHRVPKVYSYRENEVIFFNCVDLTEFVIVKDYIETNVNIFNLSLNFLITN